MEKDFIEKISPKDKERVSLYIDKDIMKRVRELCDTVFNGAKVSNLVEVILEDFVIRWNDSQNKSKQGDKK